MRPPSHSRPRAGKFAFSRILQLDDVPFGSSLADINIFCYSARACGAPLFAVSLRTAPTAAAFLPPPQLVVLAERRQLPLPRPAGRQHAAGAAAVGDTHCAGQARMINGHAQGCPLNLIAFSEFIGDVNLFRITSHAVGATGARR